MKKKVLAIGIIAILGMGYVGGAWYTGNAIEKNIDTNLSLLTEKINTDNKKFGLINEQFNVAISYSDYQKSLFSTKLHLTIMLTPKPEEGADSSSSETTNPTAKSIKVFDEDVIIHHGPFPIAALTKGTFVPQAAWIEYQITEKTSPELSKLVGNQPIFTGHLGISYQNYLRLKITNQAISLDKTNFDDLPLDSLKISKGEHYLEGDSNSQNVRVESHIADVRLIKDDNNYVLFKNLQYVFDPQLDKTNVNYELNFDHLESSVDNMHELIKVNIDNLKSKGSYNFKTQDADLKMSIAKFMFNPDQNQTNNKTQIALDKFVWEQKNHSDANNISDGSLVLSTDSLIFGQQKMGSGELNLEYRGIDKNLLTRTFNEFYSLDYYDDEDDDDDDIVDYQKMNPRNIKISLNKFNWHNVDGDIDINAVVDYTLDDNFNMSALSDTSRLNLLKLKMAVPSDVLARIITQFQHRQDSDVDVNQINKTKSQIEIVSQLFQIKTSLLSFKQGDKNGFFTDIDYDNSRQNVKVNGNTLTKEEFLDNF